MARRIESARHIVSQSRDAGYLEIDLRQLIITEELEGNLLSMYARGMGTRAISDYIREMYAMEISATEISRITDSVLPAVTE